MQTKFCCDPYDQEKLFYRGSFQTSVQILNCLEIIKLLRFGIIQIL
jgi:hypothetical protein